MKRLAIILGIMLLATASSIPAYAMAGGMEGGSMMQYWGSDLINWFQKWRNGGEYTPPSLEQRKEIGELEQQHDEDSAYLKFQIKMKEKQLDDLLGASDPDIQKIRTLNRGIRELRAEADKEERTYERETGKITPGYRSGDRNGWSSNRPTGGSDLRGMGYDAGGVEDYGSGK